MYSLAGAKKKKKGFNGYDKASMKVVFRRLGFEKRYADP